MYCIWCVFVLIISICHHFFLGVHQIEDLPQPVCVWTGNGWSALEDQCDHSGNTFISKRVLLLATSKFVSRKNRTCMSKRMVYSSIENDSLQTVHQSYGCKENFSVHACTLSRFIQKLASSVGLSWWFCLLKIAGMFVQWCINICAKAMHA